VIRWIRTRIARIGKIKHIFPSVSPFSLCVTSRLHGNLSVFPSGGAADHHGHHAGRGHQKHPPASESRGRPVADCSCPFSPSNFRLGRLRALPSRVASGVTCVQRRCVSRSDDTTAEALISYLILPITCNNRQRNRGIMCYLSKCHGSARRACARLDDAQVRQCVPPRAKFTGPWLLCNQRDFLRITEKLRIIQDTLCCVFR
jgi:hypothetical protein